MLTEVLNHYEKLDHKLLSLLKRLIGEWWSVPTLSIERTMTNDLTQFFSVSSKLTLKYRKNQLRLWSEIPQFFFHCNMCNLHQKKWSPIVRKESIFVPKQINTESRVSERWLWEQQKKNKKKNNTQNHTSTYQNANPKCNSISVCQLAFATRWREKKTTITFV